MSNENHLASFILRDLLSRICSGVRSPVPIFPAGTNLPLAADAVIGTQIFQWNDQPAQ